MSVRSTRGFSLLELVLTMAVMATVAVAVASLLRTTQTAWDAHDSDQVRLEAAHATLRHLVRHLRQADSVLKISSAADTSGVIAVEMPSGDMYVWEHYGTWVRFGVDTPRELLAEPISELSFVGYEADATTTTEQPDDIQAVKVTVGVTLERDVGAKRRLSSWVWLRTY